ncbi:MAG: hypothetical protein P8J37_24890, partial [Fuerstiella sp.]|nr:hypothetical protein [Fuerstiella sp.]
GHSVVVQNKNYVQHTEEDIEAFNRRTAFMAVKKATHKATQKPTEIDVSRQKPSRKATQFSK